MSGRLLTVRTCVLSALVVAAWSGTATTQQQPFRSGVDVVELPVAVTSGRTVVTDLTAQDFEVMDNGVRQKVLSVSRELLPIDVILVLDTSDSLKPALESAILSGANRILERLRPDDRVSLVTFNDRIQEQLPLVGPADAGRIALGPNSGQTSLNDAIGVALATRPVADRRQMGIVFTDGYDSTSLLSEADVMVLAGRSRTALFLVSQSPGFGDKESLPVLPPGSLAPPQYPTAFFERLAAATGGLAQLVPRTTTSSGTVAGAKPVSGFGTGSAAGVSVRANPNLLDEPFLKALDDFRASYVVRYALTGVPRPGWHTVGVKVIKSGKSYTIRTRSGYSG